MFNDFAAGDPEKIMERRVDPLARSLVDTKDKTSLGQHPVGPIILERIARIRSGLQRGLEGWQAIRHLRIVLDELPAFDVVRQLLDPSIDQDGFDK